MKKKQTKRSAAYRKAVKLRKEFHSVHPQVNAMYDKTVKRMTIRDRMESSFNSGKAVGFQEGMQAEKLYHKNEKKECIDKAALEMLNIIPQLAEANTRMVMAFTDLLKIAKT